MSKKPIYKGIDNYCEKNDVNLYRIFPIVFIVIFIISLLVGGKLFYDEVNHSEVLTDNKIKYYIEVSDNISKEKAQVNWQEIAAINEILNDGKKDELVPKIAEVFLSKDNNNKYTLYTIDEVLKKLNIKNEEEEKIKDLLKELEENTLYKDLYEDESKLAFINTVYSAAINNYNKYGILPSITIAQAILESGWGESELAMEHNNLFGIKADNRWNGAIATILTKENYNDTIKASFRKYDNLLESIEDHGEFLYKNERYRVNGLFDGKEYISQAQSLEDAGYSTAKDENGEKIYADKLINVIKKYNLMKFDTEVKRKS